MKRGTSKHMFDSGRNFTNASRSFFGFEYSHGTCAPTLAYYGNPVGVESGVIISSIYPLSLMSKFRVGDFLYRVGDGLVDNYGEIWSDLGVSLNLIDVFSRVGWNNSVVCGIVRDGVKMELKFEYKSSVLGSIRFLDSVLDAEKHSREMLVVRGVGLKTLRLDDVLNHRLSNYMCESKHHLFHIMVYDIDSRSLAFQAKSIRPGSILKKVNGESIPSSWRILKKCFRSIQMINR